MKELQTGVIDFEIVTLEQSMCYFITIAVPERVEGVVSGWQRRGYYISEQKNPALRKHFGNELSSWVLTNGHCSCDLVTAASKKDETQVRLRADAVEILHHFVKAAEKAFVYIHFYSGDISTEEVEVGGMRVEKLEGLGMRAVPVDMLLEFKVDAPSSKAAARHRVRPG